MHYNNITSHLEKEGGMRVGLTQSSHTRYNCFHLYSDFQTWFLCACDLLGCHDFTRILLYALDCVLNYKCPLVLIVLTVFIMHSFNDCTGVHEKDFPWSNYLSFDWRINVRFLQFKFSSGEKRQRSETFPPVKTKLSKMGLAGKSHEYSIA